MKSIFFALAILYTFITLGQDKKTQHIQVSREIKAPAAAVWKVVGEEFGDVHKSHPFVVDSKYSQEGVSEGCEGAERICSITLDGKKYVKEKQVNYDPENMKFKVQITHIQGLPLIPEYSYGVYHVVKVDDKTSKLVFTFDYRTKPAFMGSLAKGKFRKQLADYMLAVDHYVITGEEVNGENFKEIKKQYETK
ncbi:SRPBCC family protein [Flammeovirga sp. MY04]|uniref:SRPBCC family protein n=1 Tax=Flammeovirga sp. MY04 TaxID=1191459 RepID=UPI0008063C8E|nr:SRPBCC family protein [Flammeovirga sp. MY04]ANQ51201.1 SRPBCC family protein [Flammeovirga sp. MY04]